jgi:hypothetical protein
MARSLPFVLAETTHSRCSGGEEGANAAWGRLDASPGLLFPIDEKGGALMDSLERHLGKEEILFNPPYFLTD